MKQDSFPHVDCRLKLAWGGHFLDTLYITSSLEQWSAALYLSIKGLSGTISGISGILQRFPTAPEENINYSGLQCNGTNLHEIGRRD
jgi:hypothetical protein